MHAKTESIWKFHKEKRSQVLNSIPGPSESKFREYSISNAEEMMEEMPLEFFLPASQTESIAAGIIYTSCRLCNQSLTRSEVASYYDIAATTVGKYHRRTMEFYPATSSSVERLVQNCNSYNDRVSTDALRLIDATQDIDEHSRTAIAAAALAAAYTLNGNDIDPSEIADMYTRGCDIEIIHGDIHRPYTQLKQTGRENQTTREPSSTSPVQETLKRVRALFDP
jgi:hypothetical protein